MLLFQRGTVLITVTQTVEHKLLSLATPTDSVKTLNTLALAEMQGQGMLCTSFSIKNYH